MRLLRVSEPFDHPDFLYEPKIEGFRALAHARGASIPLSLGFWAIVIVVVPVMIRRAREPLGGLMAAMITLLGYVVLMNDVLR